MAKRNPTSELNHDNWDAEEEKEDAGRFKVAPEETLKKREIRVAKRRNLGGEEKGTGGLFKGFTGFSSFGGAPAATSGFGFGAQQHKPTAADTNGSKQNDPNASHLSQLKALNQSVLKWIQKHVNDNPYCVLTPIFRDYERHLAGIEEKYPYVESSDEAAPAAISSFKFAASPAAEAAKGGGKDASAGVKSSAPTFNFSASASSAGASVAPPGGVAPPKLDFAGDVTGFTFNAKPPADKMQQPTDKTQQPAQSLFGFSFASGTAANKAPAPSFSLLGSVQQQQKQDDDQEEEYEPPKPETRDIKEPGAVYTKRCKLFYMLPDTKQWRDKGVGNLHVKPAEASGKVQLIVRADNTLGTILLNTMITKEMSLTTNKNNLNFACLPNPALPGEKSDEPRLVPFLLKVKTEDDAKEVLQHLDDERQK